MIDLRTRFREADSIPAPNLWPDIESRERSTPTNAPWWPRALAAVVAIGVVGLTLALLARAFLQSATPAPLTPTPSASVPVSPRPSPLPANGMVAFVRSVPPSPLPDGFILEGELYLIRPDGSGLTMIRTGFGAHLDGAWSPEGTRLAFSDRVGQIVIVGIDGDQIAEFNDCAGADCDNYSPAWSPSGDRIAFARAHAVRGSELWVAAADGGQAELLSEAFFTIDDVDWSPDGEEISVLGFRGAGPEVGRRELSFLDAGRGSIVRSFVPEAQEFGGAISWAPDASRIVYDAFGRGGTFDGHGIYLMDPDGSNVTLLTSCPFEADLCRVSSPTFSPDGTQVAFTAGGTEIGSDGSTGDLYIVGVDGAGLQRLTGGPGLDCCPAWQPLTADVPPEARALAIGHVQGEFGPVTNIYGEAVSTLSGWRLAEPNNTSGLDIAPSDGSDPVYAVFFEGSLTVDGPVTGSGSGPVTTTFVAGRVVCDAEGEILNTQLWHTVRPVHEGFGAEFNG